MRVEWLEDILAVLDTGSLTGAAEKRFVTQSAFTRRIRQIEESVSAELFDRSKKPVKLLDHVREQESEMRHIVVRINALSNPFKFASLNSLSTHDRNDNLAETYQGSHKKWTLECKG